ncbi:MAG: VWA domain-containing protein, partial [Planctomycetes bacterium]|nr:VWA domain-containing protein [Planctomycetota bacterium]
MSFGLLNLTFVFIGLAGLALPVIAHLLSRRNYDVVEWGAMQFLELRKSAKRKLRLEQLLLMLLRMALIALAALAFARPWAQGGFLTSIITGPPRDVMIVLDGSHSMGWERKTNTPHSAGQQWVHHFLEELNPGDTVGLIDARDRSRTVIAPPTRDFAAVRHEVDTIPAPSGSSDLSDAVVKAAQILAGTGNVSREIVVLTDGQARCWHAEDENNWLRYDDLVSQVSIKPRIWVVDVAGSHSKERTNFSVDRLQPSRELTAVGYPIRLSTKIHYSGGTEPVNRRVYLEVDGQRIGEKTMQVRLQPGGQTSVEFEHRLYTPGSHVISVVLDKDNLPGDDRAEAAIEVSKAIPVLLVDGDPQLDDVRRETHFALSALTPPSNPNPWVAAKVVRWDQFTADDLQQMNIVVLANVIRLNDAQVAAISDFVAAGGGLFIALGDKVDADSYNEKLFKAGRGLLPGSLISIEREEFEQLQGVRVVNSSLEIPWISRFRAVNDGGFTDVRYTQWWKVKPARPQDQLPKSNDHSEDELDSGLSPKVSDPVIAARLNTSEPLLISRNYGQGRVLLMSAPLDADWSTFPSKHDYVSFLHEAVFHLAAGKTIRNVDVGTPLTLPVPDEFDVKAYTFIGPDKTEHAPRLTMKNGRNFVRMDDTILPGVYEFRQKEESDAAEEESLHQHFVVNFDRAESDLTPLGNSERVLLSENERMAFVDSLDELTEKIHSDGSRSELWQILLLLFLLILICEALMTRHLVKGGHTIDDTEEPHEDSADSS